ncbi:MAG: hypothetical protein HC886_02145 [Leptolyngbyaceae cyanobacterium SM1_1_3]|nr:hypothetical protein [Leptolyngbyaceae cyanobacterium SM1_1_3]
MRSSKISGSLTPFGQTLILQSRGILLLHDPALLRSQPKPRLTQDAAPHRQTLSGRLYLPGEKFFLPLKNATVFPPARKIELGVNLPHPSFGRYG